MKKIILLFLVILMLISTNVPVYAASETVNLDKTSVTEDLLKAYKNLDTFKNNSLDDDIYLITLAESGFKKSNIGSDFALYFYFHNPSGKDIAASEYNKIQLAVLWDKNGEPLKYSKFDMELISVSSDIHFLKYKVKNPQSAIYFDGNIRKYAVSGVELVGSVDFEAVDYDIGTIFEFKGYGDDISCSKTDLLTLRLECHQTSYLSGDSAKEISHGDNGAYSNQINSVYFSIPQSVLNKYGEFYGVEYEFYHYRTNPIILVNSSAADVLNTLNDNIGNDNLDFNLYSNLQTAYIGEFLLFISDYYYYIGETAKNGSNHYHGPIHDYYSTVLSVDDISNRDEILVTADQLQNYFKNYNSSNHSGVTVGSKKYNGDLFDLDNSLGYQTFYRTIEDKFSLDSYTDSKNNNFFYHLLYSKWDYISNPDDYDNSLKDVKFIEKITKSSFKSTEKATSDSLYVSELDVGDLKSFYETSTKVEEQTYLLRYAYCDDYYFTELESDNLDNTDGNVACAQESVYLDFDIITLTFRDNEKNFTVIPVVSNPTDGFSGVENTTPPPPDGLEIFNLIKKVIAIVLLVVLVSLITRLVFVIIEGTKKRKYRKYYRRQKWKK